MDCLKNYGLISFSEYVVNSNHNTTLLLPKPEKVGSIGNQIGILVYWIQVKSNVVQITDIFNFNKNLENVKHYLNSDVYIGIFT